MPPPISKQVGGNGNSKGFQKPIGYNPKRKPDPTDNILDRIAPIGFDAGEGLKILCYGRSGSGKTTLWATFPDPILALICSGGKRPGELRSVNTEENRKRIKAATINHTQDVRVIADHMTMMEERGERPYNTIVLDHATGLQDMALSEILGLDQLPEQKGWGLATQQQYGQCTARCKDMLKNLLSLSCNVVIIAQDRVFNQDEDGRMGELIRPFVGAGMSPSLTGWVNCAVDYIVYCYKRQKMEKKSIVLDDGGTIDTVEKGEGVEYCLRIGADEVITTKFRTPRRKEKMPDVIVNPTYKKILDVVEGKYGTNEKISPTKKPKP